MLYLFVKKRKPIVNVTILMRSVRLSLIFFYCLFINPCLITRSEKGHFLVNGYIDTSTFFSRPCRREKVLFLFSRFEPSPTDRKQREKDRILPSGHWLGLLVPIPNHFIYFNNWKHIFSSSSSIIRRTAGYSPRRIWRMSHTLTGYWH